MRNLADKEKAERTKAATRETDASPAAERFFGSGSPDLRGQDLIEGVSTWEALGHFVNESAAQQLYDLDLEGYADETILGHVQDEAERGPIRGKLYLYRRLLKDLSDDLFRKLWAGEMVAKGVLSSNALGPAQWIPSERWEHLELDVRSSRADGPGITILDIQVYPKLAKPAKTTNVRKLVSKPGLRTWYRERIKEAQSRNVRYSRDQDYRDAKEAFGNRVTRAMVRDVRQELAPAEWKLPGAPRH